MSDAFFIDLEDHLVELRTAPGIQLTPLLVHRNIIFSTSTVQIKLRKTHCPIFFNNANCNLAYNVHEPKCRVSYASLILKQLNQNIIAAYFHHSVPALFILV